MSKTEFKIEMREIDGKQVPVKVYEPQEAPKSWTVKSRNYLRNGAQPK